MTMLEAQVESDLLERTRAIVPQLSERAEEAAALRRVPAENIALMREAGSLKTIQSTRNGGYGLGMRAHIDTVAALAEGCASSAWCAGVIQAHSWMLSHFPVEAQDEVYGADPDAVVSAVIGPRGKATKTADGYVLSGFWPFASGNENSEWLLLGAVVHDAGGNPIDEGDFLVATSAVTRHDDWFVNGLTATGSCSVSVQNLSIPEHRYLSLAGLVMANAGPGTSAQEGWNHRCAAVPVLALALCGSAIGIARKALRDFPALIKGKTIAYTAADQYTHPNTHQQAVAIGRALMANPRLILLDEVSLGLAPIVVRQVYAALPAITGAGTTALVVEQDITQALAVADHVSCLLEGRVSLAGTPASLDRAQITSAYFGLDTAGGGHH